MHKLTHKQNCLYKIKNKGSIKIFVVKVWSNIEEKKKKETEPLLEEKKKATDKCAS